MEASHPKIEFLPETQCIFTSSNICSYTEIIHLHENPDLAVKHSESIQFEHFCRTAYIFVICVLPVRSFEFQCLANSFPHAYHLTVATTHRHSHHSLRLKSFNSPDFRARDSTSNAHSANANIKSVPQRSSPLLHRSIPSSSQMIFIFFSVFFVIL